MDGDDGAHERVGDELRAGHRDVHDVLVEGARRGRRAHQTGEAEQTQTAHISEFPVGTYKKAHRHGPGAHVIIIKGEGYSLLWPSGGGPRDGMERVDWKPGSMVVPPNGWFHQHFNGGATPARYLAFRWNSQKYYFSLGTAMEGDTDVDVKMGGAQIEYEDEDPLIHDTFAETLAKAGAESRMAEFIPRLRAG